MHVTISYYLSDEFFRIGCLFFLFISASCSRMFYSNRDVTFVDSKEHHTRLNTWRERERERERERDSNIQISTEDIIFVSKGFLIRTASRKNVFFFRSGADQKPLVSEDEKT